ncbi:MAG: septal ring lytic transglycosylase RlpA family protein [Saprospiraceae bacterium]|nr:septal ring lytic transglycosylase RlpA family protein [Saprospiraceae bacterium]
MRPFIFTLLTLVSLSVMSAFALIQDEIGKASYYADSLHGRKTASGEPYDKNAFTCAHKTLAFGTKIRVTRLDNQKSVVVRVNDRGPFVEGYVTDISRAAAESIGLIREGVTRVKIEIVEKPDGVRPGANVENSVKLVTGSAETSVSTDPKPAQYSTDPQPASTKNAVADGPTPVKLPKELYSIDVQRSRKEGFGVQISTLYDAANVIPTVKKLQQEWPKLVLVSVESDETYHKNTYRILLGPFPDSKAASIQQKAAVKKGYKGCFVVNLEDM